VIAALIVGVICFVVGLAGGVWLGAQAMTHKLQAILEEARKLV
jgi:uncharacterized protein YneF (UPF0154 family)